MIQTRLQDHCELPALPDKAMCAYFRNYGDLLRDEALLLGSAIKCILQREDTVSNTTIIQQLILLLESSDDIVAKDIIRKTLEIVLEYPSDDI